MITQGLNTRGGAVTHGLNEHYATILAYVYGYAFLRAQARMGADIGSHSLEQDLVDMPGKLATPPTQPVTTTLLPGNQKRYP